MKFEVLVLGVWAVVMTYFAGFIAMDDARQIERNNAMTARCSALEMQNTKLRRKP